MSHTIKDLPKAKEILKSPYELNFIRERLSGYFEQDFHKSREQALLELILCLSNEVAELKEQIAELKEQIASIKNK